MFDEIQMKPIVFPSQKEHPSAAYRVAFDLLEQRAPEQALDVLDEAITAEPDSLSLRSLRAWAYFVRVQLAKAEEDLRFVVEHDPSDVWARHTLGRVLERQSRLAEALPHLRLAAAMSGAPDHERAVRRVEHRLAS
ncbi:tetratricopeptide repeat protein [Nocardioides sp. AE5]|uniref:tetratricopeptide repeat protein n=1 Tax=Nocardioides sp. AE5 TaxID=2962573 RepID=UPI00288108D5|nr:tetratricopeptide repeat protein [Nocardioides sp. AE5]MDT0203341.1 tetratricopeptide repeat protein [Nocardioides sp. AE5]